MPANWEQRDKKLKKRRSFIPDNRRSIGLLVESINKRDKMLRERAERRERRAIHRKSA